MVADCWRTSPALCAYIALALAAGRGGLTDTAEDIIEEAVHLAMK
jgi:hypothetical protein